MKLERMVLGHTIRAEINRLDSGWDIGVYGGCSTHVGAVSVAEPSGEVETIERTHHKDGFVSVRWAKELSMLVQEPVCVRCGIHYDNATREQLAAIIAECDKMLQELMAVLGNSK